MQTQRSRNVLVTGANKGIGFEIARQLGRAGLRVIIGSRDSARGNAAARALHDEGLDVRSEQLNVTDRGSIAKAAANIASREKCLDILVNNAGISDPKDGSPGSADPDAVRRIMETNFFGALDVTQAMLPLLRNAPAGRIVNQSSGLGSLTLNADPAWEYTKFRLIGYNASKAALNMLTVQLAAELKAEGITVNSADPGFTATDLNGHRGVQTIPEGAAVAVRLALGPEGEMTGNFVNADGTEPW